MKNIISYHFRFLKQPVACAIGLQVTFLPLSLAQNKKQVSTETAIANVNSELKKIDVLVENYTETDLTDAYSSQESEIKSLIESGFRSAKAGLNKQCYEDLRDAVGLTQSGLSQEYTSVYTQLATCAFGMGKFEESLRYVANNLTGFAELSSEKMIENLHLLKELALKGLNEKAAQVVQSYMQLTRASTLTEQSSAAILDVVVTIGDRSLITGVITQYNLTSRKWTLPLAQALLISGKPNDAIRIIESNELVTNGDSIAFTREAQVTRAKAYGQLKQYPQAYSIFKTAKKSGELDIESERDYLQTSMALGDPKRLDELKAEVEAFQLRRVSSRGSRDWAIDRDFVKFCLRLKSFDLAQTYLEHLRSSSTKAEDAFNSYKKNSTPEELQAFIGLSFIAQPELALTVSRVHQDLSRDESENFEQRKILSLLVQSQMASDFLTKIPRLKHVEKKVKQISKELTEQGKLAVEAISLRYVLELSPADRLRLEDLKNEMNQEGLALEKWKSGYEVWKSRAHAIGLQHRFSVVKSRMLDARLNIQRLNWLSNSSALQKASIDQSKYVRLERLLSKAERLLLQAETEEMRANLTLDRFEKSSLSALVAMGDSFKIFTKIDESNSLLDPYVNNSLNPANAVFSGQVQEYSNRWSIVTRRFWEWVNAEYDKVSVIVTKKNSRLLRILDKLSGVRTGLVETRSKFEAVHKSLVPRIVTKLELAVSTLSQDIIELSALISLERANDSRQSANDFEDLQSYKRDAARKDL